MKRIEWLAKMLLGVWCYVIYIYWPTPWPANRLFHWGLSWAGFYAYDEGYPSWKYRDAAIKDANNGLRARPDSPQPDSPTSS